MESELKDILQPISKDTLNILVGNHRRFRAFLSKRVQSDSVAEDILQTSLRKAIENPSSSEDEKTVLSWFYRILRNSLIDHYRSRATDQKKHEELKHLDLGDEELKGEICECMTDLLKTLKPDYSELLRRIDLGSETPEQVAKALDLNRNNLDVKLHRARKALKISLERACGTCTEHGCLSCTCKSC